MSLFTTSLNFTTTCLHECSPKDGSSSTQNVGPCRYGAHVETDNSPGFRKGSFTCPHCGANCQQNWAVCHATDLDSDDSIEPHMNLSTCFVCSGQAVWLLTRHYLHGVSPGPVATLIHPVAARGGPVRSSDMPENAAALYDEASTVVTLSPRSASALLRLALEVLLEDLYPDDAGNLNKMIGAAVQAGLPDQVQKTMDYLRFNGNQSVHKFHHDDTQETAATLFGLLNVVVEHLVTQPKRLEALYDGLPEGFKEQVAKRDSGR